MTDGMATQATTPSSSAAATTGSSARRYLARAGRQVSRARASRARRRRCGTEEVFPGFKFSVFSYVVSLLRPEIIRDLELPRHGLHILPLESTVTPLPNGDYLAQWGDPDQNRRELARHSPRDAEAYDEFGRLMHQMARGGEADARMIPPDPGVAARRATSRRLRGSAGIFAASVASTSTVCTSS